MTEQGMGWLHGGASLGEWAAMNNTNGLAQSNQNARPQIIVTTRLVVGGMILWITSILMTRCDDTRSCLPLSIKK
jgi:hypothetical protein